MIQIIENDRNFYNDFAINKKPVVVYGAGTWGELLIETDLLEISCFCDKNAKIIREIGGIEVLTIKDIESRFMDEEIYIINTIKSRVKIQGLYAELCQYKLNAKIYNIHNNIAFLGNLEDFIFKNEKYNFFYHAYNCGYKGNRLSERSIELPIALKWLENVEGEVMEIGAVTPYYYPELIHNVVDPADKHYLVNLRESIFDVDLIGKNVLSISTVEHIGTGQYGVVEERDSIQAIDKIIRESKECLITCPLGENPKLDKWIGDNYKQDNITILTRGYFGNVWKEVDKKQFDINKLLEIYHKSLYAYTKKLLVGADTTIIIIRK